MSAARKFAVEGDFTIFTAQAVKEQLIAVLEQGREIEVDLSHVSEIDSAGLQIMIAAKCHAAARDKVIRFTGHSAAVLALFDLCDLSGYFGDPLLLPRA